MILLRERLKAAECELLHLKKNEQNVEKMIAFQEKCLGRHKSLRQIAAQLQVSRRSVQRMTKDLGYRYSKGSGFHDGMQTLEQNEKLDIGTSMTDIQMRKNSVHG